jgi:hypothetical protein
MNPGHHAPISAQLSAPAFKLGVGCTLKRKEKKERKKLALDIR